MALLPASQRLGPLGLPPPIKPTPAPGGPRFASAPRPLGLLPPITLPGRTSTSTSGRLFTPPTRQAIRQREGGGDGGGKSLWNQAVGAAVGFVPGLASLGADLARQALVLPRVGLDVVKGEADLGDVGQALVATAYGPVDFGYRQAQQIIKGVTDRDLPGPPLPISEEWRRKYQPLTEEQGASFGRTGHRIVNPEEYAKSWREGTILGTALEDLGNVALVAGAAAPLAGAAGRGLAAGGAATPARTSVGRAFMAAERPVARAAALGGEVADLGLESAIRVGGRGLKRLSIAPRQRILARMGASAEAAADAALARTGQRPPVRDPRTGLVGRLISPERAAARRFVTERVARLEDQTWQAASRARLATKPGRGLSAASTIEEQAAFGLAYGDMQQLVQVLDEAERRGIPEAQAWETTYPALQPHNLEGHSVTPEAARLAVDIIRGTADAGTVERVGRILGWSAKESRAFAAKGLVGYGYATPGATLSPAQLRSEMLPEAQARAEAVRTSAEPSLRGAADLLERRQRQVERLEGRLPAEEATLRGTTTAPQVRRLLAQAETGPVQPETPPAEAFGASGPRALATVERTARDVGQRQALTRLADRLERDVPAEPGQMVADLVAARDAIVERRLPHVEQAVRREVEHEAIFDSRATSVERGARAARRAQQRVYDQVLGEAQRGPVQAPAPPSWSPDEVAARLRRDRPVVAAELRRYATLLHDQLVAMTGGAAVTEMPMSETQWRAVMAEAEGSRRALHPDGWIDGRREQAAFYFPEFDTLAQLHPDELRRLRRQGWLRVQPDSAWGRKRPGAIGWDELADRLEAGGATLDAWVEASRWEGFGQSLAKSGAFDARKAAGGTAYSGQLSIDDVVARVTELTGDPRMGTSIFAGKRGQVGVDAGRLAQEWTEADVTGFRALTTEPVDATSWRDGYDAATVDAVLEAGDSLGFDSASWQDVAYDLFSDRFWRDHEGVLRPEDMRWFIEAQHRLAGGAPHVAPAEVSAMAAVDGVLRRAAEAFEADLADGTVGTPGQAQGWKSLSQGEWPLEARALYSSMRRNESLLAAGSRLSRTRARVAGSVGRVANEAGRLGAGAGRTAGLSEAAEAARAQADRVGGRTTTLVDESPALAGVQARAGVTSKGYAAGYRNARLLADLDRTRRLVEDAKVGYDRVKAKMDADLARIEANRLSWPARYRANIAGARRVVNEWRAAAARQAELGDFAGALAMEEVARSVPMLPPEFARAGIDPTYLPAGQSGISRPGRTSAGVRRQREAVDPFMEMHAENVRKGIERPYEVREAVDLQRAEIRRGEQNEMLRELLRPAQVENGHIVFDAMGQPTGWTTTAPDLLPEAEINSIDAQVAQVAREQRLTPEQTEQRRNEFHAEAMRRRGWAPVDVEATGLESLPRFASPEQAYWPIGFQDQLRAYWGPEASKVNPIFRGLQWGNRKFKGAVLPFSVRWQLQDIIAAPLMAWVNGGVAPWDLASYERQAYKLGIVNEGFFPRTLHEFGAAIDDTEWLHGMMTKDTSKWWQAFGRFQKRSFALNNAINGLSRRGMYLVRFEQLAEKAGFRNVDRSWTYDDLPPRLRELADEAVAQTNAALGDFAKMTVFERKYMREILPFYTWSRHVVKMTARLAVDHPLRFATLLRIGAIYGPNGDESLPSYLRYAQPFLGGGLGLESFNPWADLANNPLLSPQGFLRATSPVIKVGAAAFPGVNLGTGGSPYTRTPGTGSLSEWGREQPTPLWNRPGELAYVIASQLPQTRALLTLAPEFTVPGTGDEVTGVRLGPIRRYQTGAPQLAKRGQRYFSQTDDSRVVDPRLAALLMAIGVPVPYSQEGLQSIRESYEGARTRRIGRQEAIAKKQAMFAGRLPDEG